MTGHLFVLRLFQARSPGVALARQTSGSTLQDLQMTQILGSTLQDLPMARILCSTLQDLPMTRILGYTL
jgi:hypothetical protein